MKYRIAGALYQTESESAYIFDVSDAEAFIKSYLLTGQEGEQRIQDSVQPLSVSGKRVRAIPEEWIGSLESSITFIKSLSRQSVTRVKRTGKYEWKANFTKQGRNFT